MKRAPSWLLHPLLFSIFPVLALLTHNLDQIKASLAVRSLVISLLAAMILLTISKLLLRDWSKAALTTTIFLILFYSYGQVYSALKQTELFGLLIGRHRILGPIWALLFGAGLWWTTRKIKQVHTVTSVLNIIAVAALGLQFVQIGYFVGRSYSSPSESNETATGGTILRIPEGQTPPDIYYIILDAYTSADVLQSSFQYDNTPFLESLSEMGFYIARCSQSNYAQTELSMASALNFNYLNELNDKISKDNTDKSPLWKLIQNNAVRKTLSDLGYNTVAFETGYYWIQLEDSDFYFSPSNSTLDRLEIVGDINSFEALLLKTSAGLFLTDAATVIPQRLIAEVKYPFKRHRERVLFDLNTLPTIPVAVKSPKFVYTHIVAPHSPFVFGPEGEIVQYEEPVSEEDYLTAYRDQVRFVNSRIEQVVKDIIANSKTPPVIILQGDHGPGIGSNADRMAILNAYYLPGGEASLLYETISPVNTFRVIFNSYFGGNLDLLEDTSYFSVYGEPYNFRIIEYAQGECEGG